MGPLAGVEALLLESAFNDLAAGSIAAGAVLRFNAVRLLAGCLDCGREFEVERFCFRCPDCSSGRTTLLQGDSVILESIDLVDEIEATSPGLV
jgi:hydrogenase nickel incorporation protein HypA/HybF